MPTPNQLAQDARDVQVSAKDLLQIPQGTITEAGLRNNVSVSIQYLAAWLGGLGCVPINNLMEDAATAEISRAQIWQWIKHPGGKLDDGRKVTAELFRTITREELDKLQDRASATQAYRQRQLRACRHAHRHDHDRTGLRDVHHAARVPRNQLKHAFTHRGLPMTTARCRAASQRLANQPALEGRRAPLQGRRMSFACAARCTSSIRWRAWARRSCGSTSTRSRS